MNLLPRTANRSKKGQPAVGRLFLLATAIVFFVVLGPGVGRSISKQQDHVSWQATTSVKQVKLPSTRSDQVDIRYRQMKDRVERRQVASRLQEGKITLDPAKRKKLAILLLLAGAQAHSIRL